MRSQSLSIDQGRGGAQYSRHLLSHDDLSRIRLGRNVTSSDEITRKPLKVQKPQTEFRQRASDSQVRHVSPKNGNLYKGKINKKIGIKRHYRINKSKPGNFLTRKLLSSSKLIWILIIAMVLFGMTVTWMSYKAAKGVETPFGPSSSEQNGGIVSEDDDLDESQPDISKYSVKANMPKIISIPSINSRGRVLHLGVNASGAMAVPGNVHDTSWYNGSAVPGSGSGAAVIAGHKSGPRVPGVFMSLAKLSKGAEINVELGDGRVIKYSVVSSEKVLYENVDMLKALTPSVAGAEGLTLITCGGKYNPSTKTYDSRDIVYASRIN